MILAGDIGGTKTNLGVFEIKDGTPVPVCHESFVSQEYEDLESLVESFFEKNAKKSTMACFSNSGLRSCTSKLSVSPLWFLKLMTVTEPKN